MLSVVRNCSNQRINFYFRARIKSAPYLLRIVQMQVVLSRGILNTSLFAKFEVAELELMENALQSSTIPQDKGIAEVRVISRYRTT
jgi:hypothetical protein